MASPVVHFQLRAEDVDAMSSFYSDVFGWRIAPRRLTSVDAGVSGTYPTIEAEEGGIAGGITDRIPAKGGAMIVVEVDDVEATLELVERLGGRRRFPGTTPERMELAQGDGTHVSFGWQEFEDPEGNLVGVIQR